MATKPTPAPAPAAADPAADEPPAEPSGEPSAEPAGEPSGEPSAEPSAAEPGVVVQIGRRFRAGEDNTGADPAMFMLNGDILMWSERCGLYADEATSALYVVCDEDVKSTPIRTAEEVQEVMRLVMEQQAAGHDATMDIMKRYPTGTGGKRDRFDDQGRYQGTY